MKKVFIILIIPLIIINYSACNKSKDAIVSARDGLILRSAANKTSSRINYMPHGSRVLVIDENGPKESIYGIDANWVKVKYNNKIGWAFGGFLNYSDKKGWLTYKSHKYGFEMQYPKDWLVDELSYSRGPVICFYPQTSIGNSLVYPWDEETRVSVYTCDYFFTNTFSLDNNLSNIIFSEKPSIAWDYILKNKKPFVTVVKYEKLSKHCIGEDIGIIAYIKINNIKSRKVTEIKDAGDSVVQDIVGDIDESIRTKQENMLKSFKLLR